MTRTSPGGHAARTWGSDRTETRVAVLTTRVSVGVVLTALLTGVLAPTWVAEHAVAILLVGFFIGLPHGAVDHLVPSWSSARSGRILPLHGVLALYALVAAVALTALLLAPAASVLVLFVLSAVHFGAGEVAFAHIRRGSTWRPGIRDLPVIAGLGGLPIVLPLALWRTEADQILTTLSPTLPTLLSPLVRELGLVLVAAALLLGLLRAAAQRDRALVLEGFLLAALFAVVPPAAAFGVWFGGWHALRHVGRLMLLDGANRDDLSAGRLARPLGRFCAAAAWPTLIAVLAIAGLAVVTRESGWVAAGLAVLLGLTVPHMVVVAVQDRRGGRPTPSDVRCSGAS